MGTKRLHVHVIQIYRKNSNGESKEFTRAMEMQFGFINPQNGMEHFSKGTDLEQVYKELRLHDGFKMVKRAILDLNDNKDFYTFRFNPHGIKISNY